MTSESGPITVFRKKKVVPRANGGENLIASLLQQAQKATADLNVVDTVVHHQSSSLKNNDGVKDACPEG